MTDLPSYVLTQRKEGSESMGTTATASRGTRSTAARKSPSAPEEIHSSGEATKEKHLLWLEPSSSLHFLGLISSAIWTSALYDW